MIVDGKCKFCGVPLHLNIDGSYSVLGDPYRLMTLVCCNRCGDFRVDRRRIFDSVKAIAENLIQKGFAKEDMEWVKSKLSELVKRYMRLVADYRRQKVPEFEETMVLQLIEKPQYYAATMQQVTQMFAQKELI